MITKGAHAEMLPVEGDPTDDLGPVADQDAKFWGIVKASAPHEKTP